MVPNLGYSASCAFGTPVQEPVLPDCELIHLRQSRDRGRAVQRFGSARYHLLQSPCVSGESI